MSLVGQYAPKVFTSPVNSGGALDANIVRGNDNVMRAAFAEHDADPTIHVQSSTLAARPAAGVPGRLWVTNNAGAYEFWYDDGTSWNGLAVTNALTATKLQTARTLWGQSFDGTANVTGSLSSVTDIGMTGTLSGASTVSATTLTGTLSTGLQPNITSVGTLTAGTWNATPITDSYIATGLDVGKLTTGTTLPSNVLSSSLTSVGTLTNLTVTNPITGSVTGSSGSTTGNAATATALQTARNINGVSFNGTADITVTAAAGTLTGSTLASGVTDSSLTSLGTLSSLTVSGTATVGKVVPTANTTAGNGMYLSATNTLAFSTNGTLALAMDAAGQMSTTAINPWSLFRSLRLGGEGGAFFGADSGGSRAGFISNGYWNGTNWVANNTDGSGRIEVNSNLIQFFNAGSTANGNNISFTERARINAAGEFIIGNSDAVASPATGVLRGTNGLGTNIAGAQLLIQSGEGTGSGAGGPITFYTSAAGASGTTLRTAVERGRFDSAGSFLVGTTTATLTSSVNGFAVNSGGDMLAYRAGATAGTFNRNTNDGTIVSLRQAGTEEGTISVSGATVSYNAFAGSHWSQLLDGGRQEILRGTVMESLDELCVWPGESNERLPKAKISDTPGSKKVYGVFMDWDNDWTETNDMYVTALGAFICRINASVTVEHGDLLESNGDGTARVQADDVIRSSTIGKVTSTVKTHEYEDGTYCVPVVLYCG